MSFYRHLSSIIILTTHYIHCFSQKYTLVKQIKTVDEAETYCNINFGTSLASIHSSSDNTEATQLCTSHTKCIHSTNCQIGCSIGANDKQNEQGSNQSGWQWTDGSHFNYWNWHTGEPNQWLLFSKGEDCAMLWANNHPWYGYPGTWNDCPCDGTGDYKQWFLCNAPTSSPTNAPTIKTLTINPSNNPTISPSNNPTSQPTVTPTTFPTMIPSNSPTKNPSVTPTENPTMSPSNNPTISPTKNPIVTRIETEMKLFASPGTTMQLSMKNSPHTHHSFAIEHIYMIGGLFGAIIFLFLCVCCLLMIGCIYACKQKQKNKLNDNDQVEIIHNTNTNTNTTTDQTNTSSMIHQHHYYHHTVQLSEDIVHTIQIDNEEEGEETSATISENDEKENIELLGILSDDSDHELSVMYIEPKSRKSTKGCNDDKNNYNCGDQTNLLDDNDIVP